MAGTGTGPSQVVVFEGIGASEAAAAVGLNPWCPPIELYERLVGRLPSRPETPAQRWGKLLETPIRRAYVEATGLFVTVPAESLFHREHPWRRATPDGIVFSRRPDGSSHYDWGLEIKTGDAFHRDGWGEPGTDEIPIQYVCQVAWSMHVTGLDRFDVAVLFGGRDFQVYTVRRDLEFEAELVERVTSFWEEHVQRAVPPPVDHSKAFRHYLERRYPNPDAAYRPAGPDELSLLERILTRRSHLAELQKEDGRDCNALCAMIGDASGLETPRGRVHWKPQRPRRIIDWRSVARELQRTLELEETAFAALVDGHTQEAKASRPLRLPLSTTTDQEGGE